MSTFTILVVVVSAFAGGEMTGSKTIGLHALNSTLEYCIESIAPYFGDERKFDVDGVEHVVRTEASCYSQVQYQEKHNEDESR